MSGAEVFAAVRKVRPDIKVILTSAYSHNAVSGEHAPWAYIRKPYLTSELSELLRRAAPAERPALLARACRLGRMVGYEWARDNGIRRIDTDDLQGYEEQLSRAGGAGAALDLVEQSAKAKLAAR